MTSRGNSLEGLNSKGSLDKDMTKILPSLNRNERNVIGSFQITSADLKHHSGIINQKQLKMRKLKEFLNNSGKK